MDYSSILDSSLRFSIKHYVEDYQRTDGQDCLQQITILQIILSRREIP
jgi:hypothetical protein